MNARLEVLLVEDSTSDAQIVAAIVSSSSLEQPKLTHTGRFTDALTMLSQQTYDLVLLDLHLPDGEGIGLITQLKQQAPNTPIVVFTGLQDETVAAAALQEGAQDYVTKSDTISPDKLAKLGHTDLGNWLVRRMNYAIRRAKFRQNITADKQHSTEYTLAGSAASTAKDLVPMTASQSLPFQTTSGQREIAHTTLHAVGAGLLSLWATLHVNEGLYEEAEPLLQASLCIRQSLLGNSHPDVGVSLYNLAALYDNQFRFKEAESLFKEALDIFRNAFGAQHTYTQKIQTKVTMICQLNQAMAKHRTTLADSETND
ncbi:MAG: response regulator [Cyanobacteria bacterium J06597_16]